MLLVAMNPSVSTIHVSIQQFGCTSLTVISFFNCDHMQVSLIQLCNQFKDQAEYSTQIAKH